MERSIPRRVEREQVPVDDEAVRAALTEQCIRKEPTVSAALYSAKDWEQHFEQRWVLLDERYMRTSTEIEGSGGHIFCRACVKPKKHGRLAAYKLHVSASDDPMKVSKAGMLLLECHGCGFEMVFHRKPKVAGSFDEAGKIDPKAFAALERQMKLRAGKNVLGSGMGLYDPRMAAQGIGGDVNRGQALANEIQHLRELHRHQLIPTHEFEAHMQKVMEEAERRVNMAVNPPMYGPIKPPKGPFDPPV